MKYLVNTNWLKENLNDPNVRVVDCRFQLGKPEAGLQAYVSEHIPGAVYFDLEKDLSSEVKEHGGRHPLPNVNEIVDKLSSAGISQQTKVVVYDSENGMIASRFWWLLKYLGHEEVYILDGGLPAWKEQDYPLTVDIPVIETVNFIPNVQDSMLVEMDEVRNRKDESLIFLMDSRDRSRFQGDHEPIDKKAGHIPGAKNYFWKDVLSGEGKWKSASELQQHFKDVSKDSEIIVYCGSGVSACPNVLSLQELGYDNVKLYIGSWSDWISYPENPIEKG